MKGKGDTVDCLQGHLICYSSVPLHADGYRQNLCSTKGYPVSFVISKILGTQIVPVYIYAFQFLVLF